MNDHTGTSICDVHQWFSKAPSKAEEVDNWSQVYEKKLKLRKTVKACAPASPFLAE